MFKHAVDHEHFRTQSAKLSGQCGSPLLQTSPSILNATNSLPRPAHTDPTRPFSKQSRPSMTACPQNSQSSKITLLAPAMSRTTSNTELSQQAKSSQLHNIHADVTFDENDFDDDDVINLDDDIITPITVKINASATKSMADEPSSLPVARIQTPPIHSLAPNKTPVSTSFIDLTQTLPWSSSPLAHMRPLHTQAILPTPKAAEPAACAKRRKLPWKDHEKGRKKQPETPLKVEENSEAFKARDITTPQEQASLANIPVQEGLDFDMTYSAVKAEQKRMRQGSKTSKSKAEKTSGPIAGKRRVRDALPRVFLSDEQKKVLELVSEQKKSVFFTGSAGTGKSVLMREIIKNLREKYRREPDRVAVTASTGLAACNVGGVTLHSFAGIGLGKGTVPELVKKVRQNVKSKQRWLRTNVLIIDEVSMVDAELFDKLESIARVVRNNGRPFGGIQLVITGDFFQLPPVPGPQRLASFAFDANTWNTSINHTIGLTQVFRQKDPVFANMLNQMRVGKISEQSVLTFKSLSRPLEDHEETQATELFPTRQEVDRANQHRMKSLSGLEVEYPAIDGGTIIDPEIRAKALAGCMAAEMVKLKKGAQVMLIKNIDETLVNGTVGKVIGFMDENSYDLFKFGDDESRSMAAQSMDLTSGVGSKNKTTGLPTFPGKWPLVKFSIQDGTTRDLLCEPEMWKIELPNGEVQASRLQVPLILAWALSIHKAQGQTLERVKVDMGKIFEKGQAYVALSRATTQAGLQIINFDVRKVMAHEKVRKFYDSLYAVGELDN